MEKMIMIPKSQYLKMLETYDQTVKELEETRKALIEAAVTGLKQSGEHE